MRSQKNRLYYNYSTCNSFHFVDYYSFAVDYYGMDTDNFVEIDSELTATLDYDNHGCDWMFEKMSFHDSDFQYNVHVPMIAGSYEILVCDYEQSKIDCLRLQSITV